MFGIFKRLQSRENPAGEQGSACARRRSAEGASTSYFTPTPLFVILQAVLILTLMASFCGGSSLAYASSLNEACENTKNRGELFHAFEKIIVYLDIPPSYISLEKKNSPRSLGLMHLKNVLTVH